MRMRCQDWREEGVLIRQSDGNEGEVMVLVWRVMARPDASLVLVVIDPVLLFSLILLDWRVLPVLTVVAGGD